MEEVKKKDEIIKKAKAGLLVEKKTTTPPKSDRVRTFNVFVDNEHFSVDVDPTGDAPVISAPTRAAAPVAAPVAASPAAAAPAPAEPAVHTGPGTLLMAPMPGMIVKYEKNIGDKVSKGDTIVVLEAMKMENALPSPCDGTVQAIDFKSGDNVAKGAALCIIG
jgi:oxaloacetate decarboxylase alpha subunit/pyruvate carboxylase subunit B